MRKKGIGSWLVDFYLVLYNAVSCVLWTCTLLISVWHIMSNKTEGGKSLYEVVGWLLTFTQSLAFLEVLHSLFGLVRSNSLSTLLQVGSRLLIVWGIISLTPESRNHIGFIAMLLSWCAVEIPRYFFYFISSLTTTPPYFMLWLRYSLFIVLYPSGITGEISCIWQSLEYVKKTNILSVTMPNSLNVIFSYYWFFDFYFVGIYSWESFSLYLYASTET